MYSIVNVYIIVCKKNTKLFYSVIIYLNSYIAIVFVFSRIHN